MSAEKNLKIDKQFFSIVFCTYLDRWKKARSEKLLPNTDDAFAHCIGLKNRSSVAQYKTGMQTPDVVTFDKMLKEFSKYFPECKASIFDSQSREGTYYQESYQKQLGKSLATFCKNIGFDPEFFALLRKYTDGLKDFPIYSDIVPDPASPLEAKYKRMDNFAYAAQTHGDIHKFQIDTEDGKFITLSYADIMYVKILQDAFSDLIAIEFQKRQKEMDDALQYANSHPVYVDSNGMEFTPSVSDEVRIINSRDPVVRQCLDAMKKEGDQHKKK